ncbi:ABC transporter substrate-binding protein [Pseudoalteromonas sp. L21]|uniref:substrate-binding periplasmic protein n=1 Tax=Pseudoalteromonas sp. L21 TaxID=1539746 RepID=UPI001F161A16|nr:ABC transporter substrate-binding protein [Pseudoalteromonas sp. L21]MCF7519717.1 ABC transporter substrate-binding protein [Pseudoalteromonas sp. L21]
MSRFVVFLFFVVPFCQSEVLRVGLPDSDYPPYHFVNAEQGGIVQDILQRFSEQYAIEVQYSYAPEKRSQKMLDDGLLDGRIESIDWYTGSNQYYWSEAISFVEDVLVMPHGCHIPPIDELTGYVFMGRYAYTYPKFEHYFDSGVMHRENFYSEREMLLALMDWDHNQRIAAISLDALNWYVSRDEVFKKLTVSTYNVGKAPLQLQFSATAKTYLIKEQFNDFIKSLKASGEFAKIVSRYQ